MSKKRQSFLSTQFITAAISTTLVLVLLGTIVLFVITARNLSTFVRENINVSVLISDEMDSLQVASMEKALKQAPYAKSVEYISKEDALREEIAAQGIDPTEFIGMNPYTASFEIKINAEHANPDSIGAAVKRLKGNSNVVDVIYSKDLIKSVNDNIRKVSIILLIIAALFTYISFALINNTVRLTIFSKRFIINTMKLVGASWGFIRRPFLTPTSSRRLRTKRCAVRAVPSSCARKSSASASTMPCSPARRAARSCTSSPRRPSACARRCCPASRNTRRKS